MTATQSHPSAEPDPDPPAPADESRPPDESHPPEGDDRLAAVEAALARLLNRSADEAARAAARERVIDRQHAEIERLRAAERSGLLRPVVTDLYRLRNDLLRQAATLPAELTGERVRGLLESFADDVADALLRCGVTVLPGTVGEPPEAGRHQVTGVVPTAERQRDGSVAAVVQDGYADTESGRVLAPARIAVYRFGGQPEGEADG